MLTNEIDIKMPNAVPSFANALNITINPYFGRVVLGEVYTTDMASTNWRQVLIVPTPDLVAFAEMILKIHARVTSPQSLAGTPFPPVPETKQ